MTFERFLVLASSAFLFSHNPIRSQLYDFASCCVVTVYKVSCLLLAQANQNAALRFCILCVATCILMYERLHNTVAESCHSHAIADLVQSRNGSNVTRPLPTWGLGAGNEINQQYKGIKLPDIRHKC